MLTAAQFFVSPEVLVDTFVLAVVAVCLLAGFRWPEVASRWRHAGKALVVGGTTFAVLCAYPIWVALAGAEHISGPQQPISVLSSLSSDLLSPVVPTANQLINPASAVGQRFVLAGSPEENGGYLGIILIALLALITIRCWRRGVVRLSAALALVAMVLSLGPRLMVDGADSHIPLPFGVFTHVPVLYSLVPARYSVFVFLFAGLLIAVGADEFHGSELARRWGARRSNLVLCAGAALALLPLLPAWPNPMVPSGVPTLLEADGHLIPPGTVLLTYPFPTWPYVDAMLWQVRQGMRYKLPGGYAYRPSPTGATLAANRSVTETWLVACANGSPTGDVDTTERGEVASDLRSLDVSTVLVTAVVPNEGCAIDLFDAVLGTPSQGMAGSWIWLGVQRLLGKQGTGGVSAAQLLARGLERGSSRQRKRGLRGLPRCGEAGPAQRLCTL